MRTDKTNSNDEYDILEELSLLGRQVSEFMKKEEKMKDSNSLEFALDNRASAFLNDIENENDKKNNNLRVRENRKLNNIENDSLNVSGGTIDFLAQEVAAVNEAETKDNIHKDSEDRFLSQEPELEEINDSLAEQISNVIDEDAAFHEHKIAKKKKKKKILIGSFIAFILVLAICIIVFTKAGQKAVIETIVAPNLYDSVFEYEDVAATPPIDYDSLFAGEEQSTAVSDVNEDDIVNVLLIGVEEIEYAQNTDVMIIASMNRNTNELSIISLMRDLYVQIPGYSNNKLNSVYSFGGIDLLYDTIELNFGVQMDGYILVNFNTFETIVDLLGGINVTLTQDEASYLNRTNYISNPMNRTVVAGSQNMNGNQALGYCRIRYVSTGKESNDFGRTARHRAILDEMFDKLMNQNLFQLIGFMNEVFANVQLKTDISKTKFSEYLTEVVDVDVSVLQQYRIPADDGYYDDKVYIGEQKQWVLIPNDWQETKLLLYEYIYGDETTAQSTTLNHKTTQN